MSNVKVHITDVQGEKHTFELSADVAKSLVDIAEDAGIDLPYSCRSGACFSCCAEVQQGMEWLDNEKTGEQLIDVEPGEFLCCIGGVKKEAFDQGEDVEIEVMMLN